MPILHTIQTSSSGKTALLRQKSQQTHYYYIIATKIAKAYQYLLL